MISLKKRNNLQKKRQVKRISRSFERASPFHSLATLVDSEDTTVNKIETQELSFKIKIVSDTLQISASFTGNSSSSL